MSNIWYVYLIEYAFMQVDFFQAYLISLNEPLNGKTIYCVEHFMEGNYIKYNSNSGYISDVNRLTPQVLSCILIIIVIFVSTGRHSVILRLKSLIIN